MKHVEKKHENIKGVTSWKIELSFIFWSKKFEVVYHVNIASELETQKDHLEKHLVPDLLSETLLHKYINKNEWQPNSFDSASCYHAASDANVKHW